jgi:hypothetical protein
MYQTINVDVFVPKNNVDDIKNWDSKLQKKKKKFYFVVF